MSQEHPFRDAMEGFGRQHIEPQWFELNRPEPERYDHLWQALADMGVTLATLPETQGGMELAAADLFDIFHTLGRTSPALGCALISHATAQRLLLESGLGNEVATASFSLAGSPLDAHPDTPFSLSRSGKGWHLSGHCFTALPAADWRVLAAMSPEGLKLCRVRSDSQGTLAMAGIAAHGLRLLPMGELHFEQARLEAAEVADWPASGLAANQADGLVTALLSGLTAQVAAAARDYAIVRKQGGKLIHEHQAVQQLIGPMTLAAWPLEVLAKATLANPRQGDASASVMASGIARHAGLDAMQTLGGVGFMEDFRIERYLRDSQSIETLWIHSTARKRAASLAACQARLH